MRSSTGRPCSVSLPWIAAALYICLTVAPRAEPALTTCRQVLRLSSDDAARAHPVHLRGAVTCYIPGSQLCFVQDGSAGVYVQPAPWPRELSLGEIVEVQGVSAEGRFSPIVQFATIERTGGRTNITPRTVAIEQLNTGQFDCQRVRIEGVVQTVSRGSDSWTIQAWTGGSSATVLVFDPSLAATNLIDARVSFTGVAGTFYDSAKLTGFGLFVASKADLQILRAGAAPFAAPLRPAGKLAWYSPDGELNHRVRIRGTVTAVWGANTLFLKDSSGSIRIAGAGTLAFAPGDSIEASGFIRDIAGRPRIVEAAVRLKSRGERPPPLRATVAQILDSAPNGELLQVEAPILSSVRQEDGSAAIVLDSGGRIIPVFARETASELARGAMARVTGVYAPAPDSMKGEFAAGLWAGSKADLAIIAPPPAKAFRNFPLSRPAVISGVLALIAFAGLAIWILSIRLRSLAAAAENSGKRMEELERELQAQGQARERLGRDLHDHTIQSIYAIGLNLDDSIHILRETPEKAEGRLRTALRDLNSVIAELRNVILGLETNAIQPQEFRAALKSLALALGNEKSNRIRLDLAENALAALSPAQATEMIHLAREAMSNSIRHGRAATTSFTLNFLEDGIRFEIEDDGRGFNVEAPPGHGFGLRNMARRAEHLGARFTIYSQEGRGTRITLDIPAQKQHLSRK